MNFCLKGQVEIFCIGINYMLVSIAYFIAKAHSLSVNVTKNRLVVFVPRPEQRADAVV